MGQSMWNKHADYYSELAFSELDDTRSYLDLLGIKPTDTVLDVCCGPGRISVLAAERCAHVTGIDSAERMLEYARRNAGEHGVAERCDFKLIDWNCVLPGQNVEKHDVVIASRCPAMGDVEKLSALARKTVAIQIFANAPSIPELLNVLFSGCGEAIGPHAPAGSSPDTRAGDDPASARRAPHEIGNEQGTPAPAGQRDANPTAGASLAAHAGGPGQRPQPEGRQRGGRGAYLGLFTRAHDAGFDPNVRIMPERFRRTFPSAEDAVAWVCGLQPDRAKGNEERVAANVAPFLRKVEGGIEFCIATSAAIIWWDVRGTAAWRSW